MPQALDYMPESNSMQATRHSVPLSMKPRKGMKDRSAAPDAVEMTDGLVLKTSREARRGLGRMSRRALEGDRFGITFDGHLDIVLLSYSAYQRLLDGRGDVA